MRRFIVFILLKIDAGKNIFEGWDVVYAYRGYDATCHYALSFRVELFPTGIHVCNAKTLILLMTLPADHRSFFLIKMTALALSVVSCREIQTLGVQRGPVAIGAGSPFRRLVGEDTVFIVMMADRTVFKLRPFVVIIVGEGDFGHFRVRETFVRKHFKGFGIQKNHLAAQ
jgi:hypothetical protein